MNALVIQPDGSLRRSEVSDSERHGEFDVKLAIKAAAENRGKLVPEVGE